MALLIHPRIKLARRRRALASHSSPGLLGLLCILLLLTPCMAAPASSSDQQRSTKQDNQVLRIPKLPEQTRKHPEPKRIAIIGWYSLHIYKIQTNTKSGGGIGGISTAHYLKNDEMQSNLTQIRIFEREPQIGGRIHTVTPYDEYGVGTVETGGDLFHEDDCLVAEMARSLDSRSFIVFDHEEVNPVSMASLWDGQDLNVNPFCMEKEAFQDTRENLIKTVRQHGMSPQFWARFAQSLWKNWEMGRNSTSPMTSMPLFGHSKWEEVLAWASLEARPLLNQEVLEPYAPKFGLNSTMKRAVGCGNDNLLNRLLHRLNQQPGFSLDVNSTVTRVTRNEDQTFDVEWSRRFPSRIYNNVERFDAVVIAAPFHQTETEVDPPLPVEPEKVEYSPLHVTHFISKGPLDGRNFNLPEDYSLPHVVWNVDDSPKTNQSFTSPSFLSITTTQMYYTAGIEDDYEPLYRVLSREPFSDHDITALLDVFGKTRENITFPDQTCFVNQPDVYGHDFHWYDGYESPPQVPQYVLVGDLVNYSSGCLRTKPTVRWVHRQYWPYGIPDVQPQSGPKDEAEQLELTPGMFYLSGFEGWQGASMSQSVSNAKQVATTLLSL